MSDGETETSGVTTDSETETETETSSPTDTGEPEIPWSDVPCGEGNCVGSEICVTPGVDCDYSPCNKGGEAEWINHPPQCMPFPEHCDPGNPEACVGLEYCVQPEFFDFVDGALECAPVALDCYCS